MSSVPDDLPTAGPDNFTDGPEQPADGGADQARLACCLTTASTKADAQMIAQKVLRKGLAACVQIDGPIQSFYHWNGQQQCDEEYRLMIKTTLATWTQLQKFIDSVHPYDEPQIVLIPVIEASQGYRNWVVSQVHPSR